MFNLPKLPESRRRRNSSMTGKNESRLALKPVQVDSYRNLHAIYYRRNGRNGRNGRTGSELLMTHLTQPQMQSALAAVLHAVEHCFDDNTEQSA